MVVALFKQLALGPREARRGAGARLRPLAFIACVLALTSAKADPQAPVVDLELILAVDVSFSMSEAEQRVQREGYASAFRHPDIARAILSGPRGRIAVSYIEWAGPKYQRVLLPWTVIASYKEARRFADFLTIQPIRREAGTSISAALLRAASLFTLSKFTSQQRVIDLSGDGINNAGPPVAPIRDKLVAAGISINGLPITLRLGTSDRYESFTADYLKSYFENCVIGGLNAFVIGINSIDQFEVAIRRKLMLEIAGFTDRLWPASSSVVDCAVVGQAPGR
jgi:hypothetical protein